jgi:hypothetical protein
VVSYTVDEEAVERLVAEELPRWILERPALREQLQALLLSPEPPNERRRAGILVDRSPGAVGRVLPP